jgi:predicted TIM-barrel fold metal-dependent hydrolase
MRNEISRGGLLSLAAASLASAKPGRLLVDTHVEVWAFDPKFPFHHPEHPERKRAAEEAPIENEHGFQGMRFSPIYSPSATWLNSKELYPPWREAARVGAVFNFYILPHQMPMLEDMAGRFPGVKIVIDHLGKPDLKASDPLEISSTKQCPYRDTYPFFKATYEEFGGKQLVWGTGYPKAALGAAPMNKEREFVDKALDFYTPENRELILGKNALPIWKFPKG